VDDDSILRGSILAYPAYTGKLSLTDVVTRVVMKKYGVSDVFSHDTDFDEGDSPFGLSSKLASLRK
jgi:predicted nucleic acid-binding protein